jgi:hypothetical protein
VPLEPIGTTDRPCGIGAVRICPKFGFLEDDRSFYAGFYRW